MAETRRKGLWNVSRASWHVSRRITDHCCALVAIKPGTAVLERAKYRATSASSAKEASGLANARAIATR
jgi:hypothetical protein